MFVFRKIWRALFSWNTRSEIRSFALLLTNYYFYRPWLGQHGPCYDTHMIEIFEHLTELFKLSAKLLIFSKGFKSSAKWFKTNTQQSVFSNKFMKIKNLSFSVYILPTTLEAIPWGTTPSTSQLVTLVTYVKYLRLNDSYLKKKKKEERKDRHLD